MNIFKLKKSTYGMLLLATFILAFFMLVRVSTSTHHSTDCYKIGQAYQNGQYVDEDGWIWSNVNYVGNSQWEYTRSHNNKSISINDYTGESMSIDLDSIFAEINKTPGIDIYDLTVLNEGFFSQPRDGSHNITLTKRCDRNATPD